MSKVFTRAFRVRWSETDADGKVDITSYMRYIVETVWGWGAAGGITLEESHALGIVWVMRETQFEFFQPLRFDDCFEFTIWLLEWRRVRGTRAFERRLRDGGEVVAQGAQQVVVLDSHTMRPTSLPEYLIDFYVLEEPRAIPMERFPRLPPVPETAFVMERRVEARDVDQVGIIDNTVFGAYAEEAVVRALAAAGWSPAELAAHGLVVSPRRFHVLHQTPAVWGDRLRLSVYLRGLEDTGGGMGDRCRTARRRRCDRHVHAGLGAGGPAQRRGASAGPVARGGSRGVGCAARSGGQARRRVSRTAKYRES